MTNDATRLLGRLHDALWDRGFGEDDRGLFLVRTVFCLFADRTGALGAQRPFRTLVERSLTAQADEEGAVLSRAFLVLGTPPDERPPGLIPGLASLPFVHGKLFATSLQSPDAAVQKLMVEAARLDWTRFAPAMLGSLLLAVMQPPERRARGQHYTTEKNIRRVIDPLFLDALHEEFEALRTKRRDRARREAGLCTRCGTHPPVEGGTVCEPCHVARRDREREQYAMRRDYASYYTSVVLIVAGLGYRRVAARAIAPPVVLPAEGRGFQTGSSRRRNRRVRARARPCAICGPWCPPPRVALRSRRAATTRDRADADSATVERSALALPRPTWR